MIRRVLRRRFFEARAPEPAARAFSVASAERLYVVGDIHGRDDLLRAMLRRIEEDAAAFSDARRARVVFLGDYVDRGDHSAKVLDTLCGLKSTEDLRFEFLAGNHEAAMLAFMKDPVAGAGWFDWGGRQTLVSYGVAAVSRAPDVAELTAARAALRLKAARHSPFLEALRRYAVSGEVICAHASLDPALALEDQPDSALLWGRIPQGRMAGLPGYCLVHGHFASCEPVMGPARICVDTGAYYSGRLTAVRLDNSRTFLTVDMQDLP